MDREIQHLREVTLLRFVSLDREQQLRDAQVSLLQRLMEEKLHEMNDLKRDMLTKAEYARAHDGLVRDVSGL